MTLPALKLYGPAPHRIPVDPLFGEARGGRQLYMVERTIYMRTAFGWIRIPAGYVTDFGSIPGLAQLLTLLRLQPLGRHAWAALGHDWLYAIGEPGQKEVADRVFRDRMRLDGVNGLRRNVMYQAVRFGGGGGYARAPGWWETENFAGLDLGDYPVAPPFGREAAFRGQRWGMRPDPDWQEA